jgi:hypothetical protein
VRLPAGIRGRALCGHGTTAFCDRCRPVTAALTAAAQPPAPNRELRAQPGSWRCTARHRLAARRCGTCRSMSAACHRCGGPRCWRVTGCGATRIPRNSDVTEASPRPPIAPLRAADSPISSRAGNPAGLPPAVTESAGRDGGNVLGGHAVQVHGDLAAVAGRGDAGDGGAARAAGSGGPGAGRVQPSVAPPPYGEGAGPIASPPAVPTPAATHHQEPVNEPGHGRTRR